MENQLKALEELQEILGTEKMVIEDASEFSEPISYVIPERIHESDCLGEYYLSGVIASVNHAINSMKQVYCPLTDSYDELESVMTPRDWAIFCMLNRLECDLHI